ncbi:hypothetical protein B7463_g4354, partial [Scytalidium lignicola]
MANRQNQLKLPARLIEELGGSEVFSQNGRSRNTRVGTRKENRKAERQQKKTQRQGEPPRKRQKFANSADDESYDRPILEEKQSSVSKKGTLRDNLAPPKPKSILKRTKKADPVPSTDNDETENIPQSLRISKAVRDKLADDDEEIAALEKLLGFKGRKGLPQSFKDDGLDELLEGLDDDGDSGEDRGETAEGDDWLDRKRREAQARARTKSRESRLDRNDANSLSSGSSSELSGEDEESEAESESGLSIDGPEFPDDVSEESSNDLNDKELAFDPEANFEGFDSEEEGNSDSEGSAEQPPPQRVRENPYVAPTATSTGTASQEKYIPPSLRKPASLDTELLTRLRRQCQGLINRLTEANLISILGEIEGLYRNNPRQHVTSTLVDLLLISVCEPTSLPDTLIILPAGFITAIYKVVGTDFGAQIVQRLVELFDEHYERAVALITDGPAAATSESSKETSNLITLLAEMYNFQVVGSNLVFDYIRLFLEKLSELNAELLLKIIRVSGPQLRQDDPSSLKNIITMLRPAVASVGGEEQLSVRTKFMIETINDLKNNRMKTGGAASAVTSEHTIRMKKILGSLNSRSIKGSEPLRIGLKDIRDSDKKGKWWLVGASWAGNSTEEKDEPLNSGSVSRDVRTLNTSSDADEGTSDLLQLAREQRMNTDVRRAIFITIMSATDFQDAYLQLMKLKLKKAQELEIPQVLIHCSGAEKAYNPYYTLIAKKLCGDRKLKMAFQFSLWDLFKRMGETDDEGATAQDDGDEDALDTRHIVNLAKMYGSLVVEAGLGLKVLKNLNMTYLQSKTKIFVEVLLITVLLQTQRQAKEQRDEKAVENIFLKVKETPQLITELQYFLKMVVAKTDIAGGKQEKDTVKWACKIARKTLESLMTMDDPTI